MEQRKSRAATGAVAECASSFADLYDVHVEEVYRFVYRRCRDHSLAEDVTPGDVHGSDTQYRRSEFDLDRPAADGLRESSCRRAQASVPTRGHSGSLVR